MRKVMTMRLASTMLLATALSVAACDHRANVQCLENPNCNLTTGGMCAMAPTGNHWCAYPDASCPGGYRFSDQDVGDGVSGVCVVATDASCVALPHTCGAAGDDDCCNSPTVPAGGYFRSFDLLGDSGSGDMSAPATIRTFRLDKYEVTVSRFRAFVEAGQGTQLSPPAIGAGANPYVPGSGWEASWNQFLPASKLALIANLKCSVTFSYPTWTDAPGTHENLPINCINWYYAMAFCAWDGGFLPTEAEWNYAAAGGDKQRVYPWSNPPGSTALDASFTSYNCIEDGTASCAVTDIVPVGARPKGDGRWGQSDLAGNVSEWVLDWGETYPNPCTDCAYLGAHPNGEREIRGGNWTTSALLPLRAGARQTAPPEENSPERGVRCARAL